MELKYPHLFSPLKLGNVTLKSRVLSAPVSLQELTPDCFLTSEGIDFYELRALGGAASVTIGDGIVHEDTGRAHVKQLRLDDPLILPSLAHVARSMKRHGCVPSIELAHGGKYAGIPNLENPCPKYKPYGPIDEVINGTQVHQMDEEMILMLVKAFGDGAARAKRAGMEMVMVHAGHGWLLSQFMSPTNTRTDKWGGSLENRMRFPVMVCQAIREAVGPGFPIEFRMNALELYDAGHGLDEAIEMAKIIQDYVDMIQVSAGNQEIQETFVRTHPSMFLPYGVNVELTAAIKKHVRIPVAAVGNINDPAMCEEIIASGKADAVEMARALIADPFWPTKARAGQDEEIVKCIRCFACMDGMIDTRDTYCALNPIIGEEESFFCPKPMPKVSKKVLIAGGGPGGMRAAITAAERGHQVILCEASDKLGGQTLCEKHVDFKQDYYGFGQWLIRQVKKFDNIEIRMNTPVTPALVDEIAPDSLIVAVGATPIVPNIPGIDRENVIFCSELAKDEPKVGQKVVIIGAGLVGAESAVHFQREGKEVTIVEMKNDFAGDSNPFQKMALAGEYRKGNVELKLSTVAKEITAEGVLCVDAEGKEVLYPADTVFCAVGMKAPEELVDSLRNAVYDVHIIGDCHKPGKVQSAVHSGYYVALNL